jgi:hypothetical protein
MFNNPDPNPVPLTGAGDPDETLDQPEQGAEITSVMAGREFEGEG